MELKKKISVITFILVIGVTIFSWGQETVVTESQSDINNSNIDLILLNGTGAPITAIEIRSKQDKNVYALNSIMFEDQKAFGIDLPAQMEIQSKFQVIIKYGKKVAKTKKIEIEKKVDNIVPVYLLNIKGKDSTIPLAAGVAAGSAATAGIAATGTAIVSGAGWAMTAFNLTGPGAAALTGVLAWVGSAVGGGMAVGVATVAAIPLAIGGTVFGTWYLLKADTLVLTKVLVQP